MKTLGYMARDQWGDYYHIGDNPPRKWLLEHFDRQHCGKMYTDSLKTGKARHIGYIIAGRWLEVYRVCQWKESR